MERFVCLSLSIVVAFSTQARAVPPEVVPRHSEGGEPPSGRHVDMPLFERDRLTGDWWGARSELKGHGLTIGGAYVAEFSSVLDGGVRESGSFRNLLTIDAELDLGVAFGVEGGTVFIQYLSVNAEHGGSADSGDLQVYSNIENDRSLDVIYELWYEQMLLSDRVRIKLGKVDANSEFDYVGVAGDFANSSAGFSPTILGFPSYPDPATSVNVFATVLDRGGVQLTLGYGLYDGAAGVDGVRTGVRGPAGFFGDDRSGDYFHIGQAELRWDHAESRGGVFAVGRVSAGVWHHDGEFERFDDGTESGTTGFFLTAEARLVGADDERGLWAFGQFGWADDAVSEIAHHVGAGFVWRGPWGGRPDDSVGVYYTLADLSDGFALNQNDEHVVDVYCRVQVTPAVFVQPEVQYIVNPAGDPSADDALVAGLRIGVIF